MLSAKPALGENPALSYRNMRAIIGYVGLTLPVVLLIAGVVDGHIESSISAYYYTKGRERLHRISVRDRRLPAGLPPDIVGD
jgi:hypothetical protein